MVIATVVSAVAALLAVRFAADAVHETRELRREDRLARLADLVAELGRLALNVGQRDPRYAIERARVSAMLAPLDDPLPSCRLLATGDEFVIPAQLGDKRLTRVEEVTLAALDELAALMRAQADPAS